MPAIMTYGGIAFAVLGLLVAIAGMPDRAAGLGLGSDLIQAGATLIAGGLVVAALGQVLKALHNVAERVEDAGFGLSSPRPSLNDELSEAPMPLPRASRGAPVTPDTDDLAEAPATPPAREPRSPRTSPLAPRAASRSAPEAQRPQSRPSARAAQRPEVAFNAPRQDDDFADDFSAEQQDGHPEPRWVRAQAEANNRQQAGGVIPMQSSRPSRATPAAPATPPRREAAPAPAAYEAEPRRRPAPPQPEEVQHAEPTVVRSGIIGGMAYTLYSDRSIEAELPAGTVRFGSIEELQQHVRRAGVDEQEEYRNQNGAQH